VKVTAQNRNLHCTRLKNRMCLIGWNALSELVYSIDRDFHRQKFLFFPFARNHKLRIKNIYLRVNISIFGISFKIETSFKLDAL